MRGRARAALAALALFALTRLAQASPPRLPSIEGGERKLNGLLGDLPRQPSIMPNAFVQWDEAGRMRTIELDDLTPFRVRFSIPF